MPYLCPQCETVFPNWGTIKGHLILTHKAQEYKESTKEQIEQFAITEDDAKERRRKKVLGKAAAIKEVPTEPVERLEAVLQINRVDPDTIETVLTLFRFTPRAWGDPYQLDDLLRPRVKPKEIIPSIVKLYIDAVEIPQETAERYSIPARPGSTPYYPGGEGGRGGEYPGYPRPRGADVVTQADLWADRERQRVEADLRETQKRLAAVEASAAHTVERGTETKTMTIADEHGNPMIVPYDPTLMDAIRREQEARARKAEREELLNQMTGLGLGKGAGGEDVKEAVKEALKPYEEEIKASREQITKLQDELRQQQQDQTKKQIEAAQEEAKGAKAEAREAKEMAAAAAKGDKTIADYLGEAGVEAKDAVQKAAKDIKEGLTEAGDRVASIVTGRAPTRREAPKSPGDVAAIMEAENEFLAKLQPKGG